MIRRLHSRIIGMGSVCGITKPSPPAELFLKSLPSPAEVDPAKYERFKQEEEMRQDVGRCGHHLPFQKSPEPFYDLVRGAAGHKHVVLMLSDGNLITFGDNAYGQTGSPMTSKGNSPLSLSATGKSRLDDAHEPLYIDLGDSLIPSSGAGVPQVSCGSNFSFVYLKGGRRVIAFGNNHFGQLGLGHKKLVDVSKGFEAWNPVAPWWSDNKSGIESLNCGFNHSVLQLENGDLFAFGSNTWGELAIGTTTSPMYPTPVTFFKEKGIRVKKVAVGNSFTLFLTDEGRVFGCGATDEGQLPVNAFEPVPIPIGRHFIKNADGTPVVSDKKPDPTKLIRVKDIACAGSLAAFLTYKNEVLIQGGFRDYGQSIRSPRLQLVQQEKALTVFRQALGLNTQGENDLLDVRVESLESGPQTVLLRYSNGCVAGFGSNAEGELHCQMKKFHGKDVNVAPAFSTDEAYPVFIPLVTDFKTYAAPWFLMGKGFTLSVDSDDVLRLPAEAPPIELPPGQGRRGMEKKSLLRV